MTLEVGQIARWNTQDNYEIICYVAENGVSSRAMHTNGMIEDIDESLYFAINHFSLITDIFV